MLLIDYFDRGAALRPDGACLISAADGSTITYRVASEVSHRVASSLLTSGIRPGTRVGILSPNDPRAFLALLGVLRCNAVWVPLNYRSQVGELRALIDKTGCEVLFFEETLAPVAEELSATCASLRLQIALGEGEHARPILEEWMAQPGAVAPRPVHDSASLAILIGTGGTTGSPKAVPVTHAMMEAMTLAFTTHMPLPEEPVLAVAAPMTHAAGVIAWPTLSAGGALLVHSGVDAEALLTSIGTYKVTSLFLPPTAIYSLLDHPGVGDYDYSSLTHFIYASAPMSVEKLRRALEVFGPVMCQTYGQAEAPMIATCLAPAEHIEAVTVPGKSGRLASVGRPSIVADVAIMNGDGHLLPAGDVGEIVVRGSLVMSGYVGDEAESERVRRPGGWHGTSDVGYKDADGYVYIVDRLRDMIITGGFNVWPSEVEQVIHEHPDVRDCAVVGVPDAKWGEKVTAVVELSAGASVSPDELIHRCREQLGPVKTPKQVIFKALPRSAVGKVLKRDLRESLTQS